MIPVSRASPSGDPALRARRLSFIAFDLPDTTFIATPAGPTAIDHIGSITRKKTKKLAKFTWTGAGGKIITAAWQSGFLMEEEAEKVSDINHYLDDLSMLSVESLDEDKS